MCTGVHMRVAYNNMESSYNNVRNFIHEHFVCLLHITIKWNNKLNFCCDFGQLLHKFILVKVHIPSLWTMKFNYTLLLIQINSGIYWLIFILWYSGNYSSNQFSVEDDTTYQAPRKWSNGCNVQTGITPRKFLL